MKIEADKLKERAEVDEFKKYYSNSLVHLKDKVEILNFLALAIDFEGPDGYYYDDLEKRLIIFEHFEFDCSPKNAKGSKMRRNSGNVNREINNEIKDSANEYRSTKVIEQGYSYMNGDTKTFYFGKDGDKYRDNYIKNFSSSFSDHISKIGNYIKKLKVEIKSEPEIIEVCFLIEDKTMFGTRYLKNGSLGEKLILTETKQFWDLFSNSRVDYIISARLDDRLVSFASKVNEPENLIDLKEKEFYIIAAAPVNTFAKKPS